MSGAKSSKRTECKQKIEIKMHTQQQQRVPPLAANSTSFSLDSLIFLVMPLVRNGGNSSATSSSCAPRKLAILNRI